MYFVKHEVNNPFIETKYNRKKIFSDKLKTQYYSNAPLQKSYGIATITVKLYKRIGEG